MDVVITAVLAVIGSALTALVTYRVAMRKSSGSVDTSEAQELWQASQVFRDQLMNEANAQRQEVAALRTEAASMRSEMAELRSESAASRAEVALLREAGARQTEELRLCREQNTEYRRKLAQAGLHDDRQS